MASSIFRVSRTETEGQQSGPATLNKAQEPVKMRVYEDESDVDLSEIGDKEIFAVEEENDLANVYVTDLVQEGNMNPVTSNAVARFTGANYSTSEVKTSNTWIDGKPIYRITKEGTANFSNDDWTTITVFNDGVQKNIVKLDIVAETVCLRLESRTITNTLNLSTATTRGGNGYSKSNVKYVITIEYTKATD